MLKIANLNFTFIIEAYSQKKHHNLNVRIEKNEQIILINYNIYNNNFLYR